MLPNEGRARHPAGRLRAEGACACGETPEEATLPQPGQAAWKVMGMENRNGAPRAGPARWVSVAGVMIDWAINAAWHPAMVRYLELRAA